MYFKVHSVRARGFFLNSVLCLTKSKPVLQLDVTSSIILENLPKLGKFLFLLSLGHFSEYKLSEYIRSLYCKKKKIYYGSILQIDSIYVN